MKVHGGTQLRGEYDDKERGKDIKQQNTFHKTPAELYISLL